MLFKEIQTRNSAVVTDIKSDINMSESVSDLTIQFKESFSNNRKEFLLDTIKHSLNEERNWMLNPEASIGKFHNTYLSDLKDLKVKLNLIYEGFEEEIVECHNNLVLRLTKYRDDDSIDIESVNLMANRFNLTKDHPMINNGPITFLRDKSLFKSTVGNALKDYNNIGGSYKVIVEELIGICNDPNEMERKLEGLFKSPLQNVTVDITEFDDVTSMLSNSDGDIELARCTYNAIDILLNQVMSFLSSSEELLTNIDCKSLEYNSFNHVYSELVEIITFYIKVMGYKLSAIKDRRKQNEKILFMFLHGENSEVLL